MAIVRYTREEIEALPSTTDWERLRNMKDEDIDTSDPDAPELSFALQHDKIGIPTLGHHKPT